MLRPCYLCTLSSLVLASGLQGCVTPGPMASVPSEASAPVRAGDLIVKLRPAGSPEAIEDLRRRYGATVTASLLPGVERWTIHGTVPPEDLLAQVRAEAAVEFAQPNYVRRIQGLQPQLTTTLSRQWYLGALAGMSIQGAWDRFDTTPGAGVVVAVIDSGVDTSHPALRDSLLDDPTAPVDRPPWGKRFIDEIGDGSQGLEAAFRNADGHGHGTHVAGLIAAHVTGSDGIQGVAPGAKLLPVKTQDRFGNGDDFTIARGMKDAVDAGAMIINFSVGGSEPAPVIAEAMAYGFTRGVSFIIAAGNDTNETPVYYPAAYAGAIAVGAVGSNGKVASYSNTGRELALVAPGGDHGATDAAHGIYSTTPSYPGFTIAAQTSRSYGTLVGTSMATPLVTGVAALVLSDARSRGQTLSPAQLRTRLLATTTEVGPPGFDPASGFGMINPTRALAFRSHEGVPL